MEPFKEQIVLTDNILHLNQYEQDFRLELDRISSAFWITGPAPKNWKPGDRVKITIQKEPNPDAQS